MRIYEEMIGYTQAFSIIISQCISGTSFEEIAFLSANFNKTPSCVEVFNLVQEHIFVIVKEFFLGHFYDLILRYCL